MKKRIFSGFIAFIGFILSPVSWWNDLIVNFPISYLLAIPIGLIKKDFFLPAFIIIYWLTNVVGLLLMHWGIIGVKDGKAPVMNRKEVLKTFGFGMLYTILIVILILTGILEFPTELLDKFNQLQE